jgi:hypothetical protein
MFRLTAVVARQREVKLDSMDTLDSTTVLRTINGRRTLSFGMFSRRYQLKISSGTLYRVALVRTVVSENCRLHLASQKTVFSVLRPLIVSL